MLGAVYCEMERQAHYELVAIRATQSFRVSAFGAFAQLTRGAFNLVLRCLVPIY
jgi:hypothetical protein